MADVRFKEGSYDEYNAVTPDENNFYKVENSNSNDEDAYDVYLGNVQLNNGRLMNNIVAQIEDLDKRIHDLENPVDIGTYDYATILLNITITAYTSTSYSNDFNISLTDSSGNILNISSVGKINNEDDLIFTAGISDTFTLIGNSNETTEYIIEIPLVVTDLYCIITCLESDADSYYMYENENRVSKPADKTEPYSTSPLSLVTNENKIEVQYNYRDFF